MQTLRTPARVSAFRAGAAPRLAIRSRTPLVVLSATVSTNDFKNGLTVEIDSQPYKVVEFLHVKPGKGAAFVRSKLRSFISGGVVEKTFRAGEMVNIADIQKTEGQFTYMEGDEFVFMDTETYEETRLKRDDWAEYLKEGTKVELLFYNGKVISVDVPQFMDLKVVETSPNVKGNTVSGGSKPAKLETGAMVQVPLFIELGETIQIDTRTGGYLSRSQKK
ncbi:Elongation factor P [Tetrabaena socialis]|uniref:Elongation factor P n=1 Tax=Tetrabaena socialis TaxID=47790 RepID=A0A2J8AEQ4_9CHLO|nr:Elongation factor P [Tetrabaena socialis]|eukprot:PNH11005.1 Elongation factor P [Tetrabaena socialis]